MTEKKFTCVLGKDYHIINNNVDNMTYFLQERNDVVKLVWVLNEQQVIITALKEENEQLRQTMQKVCELLEEEVDLFSDEATEHDIIAYSEMQKFDNKDAYYICVSTKKAIEKLKRWNE